MMEVSEWQRERSCPGDGRPGPDKHHMHHKRRHWRQLLGTGRDYEEAMCVPSSVIAVFADYSQEQLVLLWPIR